VVIMVSQTCRSIIRGSVLAITSCVSQLQRVGRVSQRSTLGPWWADGTPPAAGI